MNKQALFPDMFPDMYEGKDQRDQEILGDLEYLGPVEFSHGDWHLIAKVAKNNGDGADVEIYECRLPARFFRLVVPPYKNSVGEPQPGFSMSTGSGDKLGRLILEIAREVAKGMIGIDQEGS